MFPYRFGYLAAAIRFALGYRPEGFSMEIQDPERDEDLLINNFWEDELKPTSFGYYFSVGLRVSNSYDFVSSFFKLASDGTVLWEKYYAPGTVAPDADGYLGLGAENISPMDNGDLLVVTASTNLGNRFRYGSLARLHRDTGAVVETRTFNYQPSAFANPRFFPKFNAPVDDGDVTHISIGAGQTRVTGKNIISGVVLGITNSLEINFARNIFFDGGIVYDPEGADPAKNFEVDSGAVDATLGRILVAGFTGGAGTAQEPEDVIHFFSLGTDGTFVSSGTFKAPFPYYDDIHAVPLPGGGWGIVAAYYPEIDEDPDFYYLSSLLLIVLDEDCDIVVAKEVRGQYYLASDDYDELYYPKITADSAGNIFIMFDNNVGSSNSAEDVVEIMKFSRLGELLAHRSYASFDSTTSLNYSFGGRIGVDSPGAQEQLYLQIDMADGLGGYITNFFHVSLDLPELEDLSPLIVNHPVRAQVLAIEHTVSAVNLNMNSYTLATTPSAQVSTEYAELELALVTTPIFPYP